MAAHDYHLITHWRVRARLEDVYNVLIRPEHYPFWWPKVFLDVRELPGEWLTGDRVACFHVKGYLPYTLRFQARVPERRFPHGFTIETTGDFNGRGLWSFEQHGDCVHTTYDWQVRVTKPIVRYASLLLKPLFASNHYWVMRRGEESLRALLHGPTAVEPIWKSLA
jgi:hypothetical protein